MLLFLKKLIFLRKYKQNKKRIYENEFLKNEFNNDQKFIFKLLDLYFQKKDRTEISILIHLHNNYIGKILDPHYIKFENIIAYYTHQTDLKKNDVQFIKEIAKFYPYIIDYISKSSKDILLKEYSFIKSIFGYYPKVLKDIDGAMLKYLVKSYSYDFNNIMDLNYSELTAIFDFLPDRMLYNDYFITKFNKNIPNSRNLVQIKTEKLKIPDKLNFLFLLIKNELITNDIFIKDTKKLNEIDRLNYLFNLKYKYEIDLDYSFEYLKKINFKNNLINTNSLEKAISNEQIFRFINLSSWPIVICKNQDSEKIYYFKIGEILEACCYSIYELLSSSGFKIKEIKITSNRENEKYILEKIELIDEKFFFNNDNLNSSYLNNNELSYITSIYTEQTYMYEDERIEPVINKLFSDRKEKIYFCNKNIFLQYKNIINITDFEIEIRNTNYIIDILTSNPSEINNLPYSMAMNLNYLGGKSHKKDLNAISEFDHAISLSISSLKESNFYLDEIIDYLVNNSLYSYLSVPENLKIKFAVKAIKNNNKIYNLPRNLLINKEFILSEIKNNKNIYNYLPKELKSDNVFTEELLNKNSEIITYINKYNDRYKKPEFKVKIINFKFFYAPYIYRTWPKIYVLSEDGILYSKYLFKYNYSEDTKQFNFVDFKESDYSYGGYQKMHEISFDVALKTNLISQSNWVKEYVSHKTKILQNKLAVKFDDKEKLLDFKGYDKENKYNIVVNSLEFKDDKIFLNLIHYFNFNNINIAKYNLVKIEHALVVLSENHFINYTAFYKEITTHYKFEYFFMKNYEEIFEDFLN